MHNWRLLLLAFLAAIQPIASFSKRNLVDGLQECCDRQPHTLLRDSRLLHETHRYSKSTPEHHRLEKQDELREDRRYEVRYPILTRHSSERLFLNTREKNIRHTARHSRAENSLGRITENRERFSSRADASKISVGEIKDDINQRISRERITREHSRDRLESNRLTRDKRTFSRLDNERYSRISSDSRREEHLMRDNSSKLRRILSTHDVPRNINDGTQTESNKYKQNNRHILREQHNTETQRSELRSEMENKRERQYLDRRVREGNDVSRRSLPQEARNTLREIVRVNLRNDIREDRERIHLRTNERSGARISQQHDANRVQRDRTIPVRSSEEHMQKHEELKKVTRTDRRSSDEKNRINESFDSTRMADIKNIKKNARHSRSRNIENSRLEREIRLSRHVGNKRLGKNRQEIRYTTEGSKRSVLESGHVGNERFTRNQQNTRVGIRSTAITRKESEQFSIYQQRIISEERRSRQNNARIVGNRRNTRRVDRRPAVSSEENQRVTKILQEITNEKRSRITSHEDGDRFAKTRQDIRRDGRLSTAVTRAQNEQLSKNRLEIRYEDTARRHDIGRGQHVKSVDRRPSVTREENTSSRNRHTKNVEWRSIDASRENSDRIGRNRLETRNAEIRAPSLTQGENISSSQNEKELLRNNERYSRDDNRMERKIFSRNRREVRSDKRRSQVDNRNNRHRSLNRQELRNNERYSRLDSRNDRDVRKDALKIKERQTSRSHDSVVDRSRSVNRLNTRENVLSRSADTVARDISRTRDLRLREVVVARFRKSNVLNRVIAGSKMLTKMQIGQPIIGFNWQLILYTLQGIYLCSFLMQMLTDNTKNTTKSRSLSWLALPSQNLYKLD